MLTPCPEWEEKLAAMHPDDLSIGERESLDRHLETCPACASALADYRNMDLLLPKLFPLKHPLDFRWNIVEEKQTEQDLPSFTDDRCSKRTAPARPLNQSQMEEFFGANPQISDNVSLLRHARLFLQEEKGVQALSLLERVLPANQKEQKDLSYLLGWSYLQQNRLDDAVRVLFSSSSNEDVQTPSIQADSQHMSSAVSLLKLGDTAVSLSFYEEAACHYLQCLNLMRIHHISLWAEQVKASYGLALTYVMRGFHSQALEAYRDALGLLELAEEAIDDGDRANVYYGLCFTYKTIGDLPQALKFGKLALKLYQKIEDLPFEGRMRNLLGRIYCLWGDYETAEKQYKKALAIAQQAQDAGRRMVMVNYAALADLSLARGCVDEAKNLCEQALEISDSLSDAHYLCGLTWIAVGKTVEAEAGGASGKEQQKLLQSSIQDFTKAKELLAHTQAYKERAEVDWRLAVLLDKQKHISPG